MYSLSKSVQNLKTENENLKRSNAKLQTQLNSVSSMLYYMEGQSRRNNLCFNSQQGRFDGDWEVTEEKVRSFIWNEMGMTMHEHVEIESLWVHRLKSVDRNKCTVIVNFIKNKDQEASRRKANVIFYSETPFSVQADYTSS